MIVLGPPKNIIYSIANLSRDNKSINPVLVLTQILRIFLRITLNSEENSNLRTFLFIEQKSIHRTVLR